MAVLDYNIAVTGDCSNNNSGAFNLYVSGGTPPYTVEFIILFMPLKQLLFNQHL
jgi:hypothetical protein